MKPTHLRIGVLITMLFFAAGALLIQLYRVAHDEQAITASTKQGRYSLELPLSEGAVYDRNFARLTQPLHTWYAIVNPTADATAALYTKLIDRTAFQDAVKDGAPFCCRVTDNAVSNPNVQILEGYCAENGLQTAQHLIGYRQNGAGVCGLQAACADILMAYDCSANATFSVDAYGNVLAGMEQNTKVQGNPHGGIVTTLDKQFQQITELTLKNADPNPAAAIVMDVHTGEILAMASRPLYDTAHLAEAMKRTDAPFLNRALCSYSVGSVFKLVTTAAALESGFSTGYMYECSGQTSVHGQVFRCHHAAGHGLLDMRAALVNSCNPYFINLSKILCADALHHTAEQLGFGQPIALADGLAASAGYLQTVSELEIEAEKANFSFGQGKLLASPLQIAAMTACIANGGVYISPWVLRGETVDGETLISYPSPEARQVLQPQNAEAIQDMMVAVLTEGEHANGIPKNMTAGGKTSTAQTGQFSEDGTEYCHAWMTGFFPADAPQYAVTVFVERGGSGNTAAAPIFREIIERISALN